MVRSRAVKRREHLGLVWSSAEKDFIRPEQSSKQQQTVAESGAIYHTNLAVEPNLAVDPNLSAAPEFAEALVSEEFSPQGESRFRERFNFPKISLLRPKEQWQAEDQAKPEAGSISQKISSYRARIWKNLEDNSEENRDKSEAAEDLTKPEEKRGFPSLTAVRLHVGEGFLKGLDWTGVAWGWVVSLALTIAVFAGAALYVALTPGTVFYLSTYLMLNKVASPLLGGFITGMRVKQKAWQTGMMVGLGYGLAVLVFRLYAGLFTSFWFEVWSGLAISLVAGVMGGALGRIIAPRGKGSSRNLAVNSNSERLKVKQYNH